MTKETGRGLCLERTIVERIGETARLGKQGTLSEVFESLGIKGLSREAFFDAVMRLKDRQLIFKK